MIRIDLENIISRFIDKLALFAQYSLPKAFYKFWRNFKNLYSFWFNIMTSYIELTNWILMCGRWILSKKYVWCRYFMPGWYGRLYHDNECKINVKPHRKLQNREDALNIFIIVEQMLINTNTIVSPIFYLVELSFNADNHFRINCLDIIEKQALSDHIN